MKFVFVPRTKSLESERELIFESNAPLRQDKENWYVVDLGGIQHTVKKRGYKIIRTQ